MSDHATFQSHVVADVYAKFEENTITFEGTYASSVRAHDSFNISPQTCFVRVITVNMYVSQIC